jgi:hypothetical protein
MFQKGDRVEVQHETGTEYGTVDAVFEGGGKYHIHFDDDTYTYIPARMVRRANVAHYAAVPSYDGNGHTGFWAVCPISTSVGGEKAVVYGTRAYCEIVAGALNARLNNR